MNNNQVERTAQRLPEIFKKALLKDGVEGIDDLSYRQTDKAIQYGILDEFDIPTLCNFENTEAVQEMRKLGITMVAHVWSKHGVEVKKYLKGNHLK